jgi:hypothetical protein
MVADPWRAWHSDREVIVQGSEISRVVRQPVRPEIMEVIAQRS